jgi:hypothetical protein
MLNKWDYSGVDEICYSDVAQLSYKKSAEFLGDTVEDWGCGTGWSRRFFKNYRGIDASPSRFVAPRDVVDLVNYTSDVDNILMRQVLELNADWRKILENVKKSFRKKFCLVVFTPLAEVTHIGCVEKAYTATDVERDFSHSLIFFNKQEILDYFPEKEFTVKEETVATGQGYNQDWILYVERIA